MTERIEILNESRTFNGEIISGGILTDGILYGSGSVIGFNNTEFSDNQGGASACVNLIDCDTVIDGGGFIANSATVRGYLGGALYASGGTL
ncbi:MAG: hypothetical protein PHI85_02605 [Victivallaceae bacterium]|nr:hypothetical protein [Victivallaceae bacterium]